MKVFVVAVLMSLVALSICQTTDEIQCVANAVASNPDLDSAVDQNCADFNVQVRNNHHYCCACMHCDFSPDCIESCSFPAGAV